MSSPFGAVVQANADFDKARYEKYARSAQPRSQTIINNPEYAWHLRQNVTPDSAIYLRNVDADGDGNDWKQYTPEAYFDKYGHQTLDGKLGLKIGNEPGFTEEIIGRANGFAREAVKRRIPVCLPSPPVGSTPSSAEGWDRPAYAEFAALLCAHPDLLCYDPHEYFFGLPTSGMITKDTQPGDVLFFTHALARRDQWPKSLEEITNNYHVGRVRHFFEHCRRKHPGSKPTVDLGELGSEFVADNAKMEAWGKGIAASGGAKNIAGYKTLEDFWRNVLPQFTSVQAANMECLKWLAEVILLPLGLRSFRLFIVGDFKGEDAQGKPVSLWADTNMDTDPAMLDLLAAYRSPARPQPSPAPIPPAPPLPVFPVDFDSRKQKARVHSATPWVIRDLPAQTGKALGLIREGMTVRYIPADLLTPAEKIETSIAARAGYWLPIWTDQLGDLPVKGWVWAGQITFESLPDEQLVTAIEIAKLRSNLERLQGDFAQLPDLFKALISPYQDEIKDCLALANKVMQSVQIQGDKPHEPA